ncbi:AMP-binding protein [Phocaeicola sp.]|uniref:AMP-binding protein n=1 Tax=Phocaeicola sp. TaxID=2773926 RepID=UPI0023C73164|nr:AMP-binding protein [Phocaeicola sp.]MDE5678235.1 AMP-binding protein [Phocaeicola sp.]
MTNFHTNRHKQTILIENIPYNNWEIEMVRMNTPSDNQNFRQELFSFLSEWFAPANTLSVHTSGSTGTPKELYVEKDRMMASACLTCSFLKLQEGDTALLCMPLKYIAGKMVVVRALTAGLNLLPVTPSGHPMKTLTKAPVFAAMTPMQVYNSLQVSKEASLLRQIRHLIIGGGAIDTQLGKALKDFPHAVWSTYGMTETLSHIALRRLNGPEASEWYTPFKKIKIRRSKENTLIIYAPDICEKELVTNDIAKMNDKGQFRILGRKDNTINTGGVKVQTEEVEAALRGHLSVPFQITSAPDKKFGEIIVLLVEGQIPKEMEQTCTHVLPPYWRPKRIIPVFRLPLTETGKPDRALAKLLAQTPPTEP